MQVDVIDAKKTAMIVVDMQNDFVASGAAMETPAARAVVPKLAEALNICRDAQIKVIYTAHVHRRDGCDMGLFDDMHPLIANRAALVDGTPGVDIYPELAPAPGEHVIKKHRYSGFFGTDLDIILREWGVDTGHHLGDDHRELLPRRGTRCFATTGSSFCRTRQPPMTTRTEDLARCQRPTSITPRW
jgi:isochorismate hydrolase